MSKTNDWLIGMQEDAELMTLKDFISKHGTSNVEIWERVQDENEQHERAEARHDQFLEAQGEGE